MPIFKANNRIGHFAHIPKCGGSSIEDYCRKLGICVAFLNQEHDATPDSMKWSKSSPQHIDGYSFSRLFPPEFFDFYFTVCRHPISRLTSAFKFQMLSEKKISLDIDLSEFVELDLRKIIEGPPAFDNHFLPQTRFLFRKQKYRLFKLEGGLDPVKHYLDNHFFGAATTVQIGQENKTEEYFKIDSKRLELTPRARKIVGDLYHHDFEFFKYALAP
jgi:hypothetical protein